MKNRITKRLVMLAVLCVMTMALASTALAAGFSKVYGQTQDKVRVRASASTSATIVDNIIKGACVYVTESKTNGSSMFVKVNYRNSDGDINSGWICRTDGKQTYVTILSADQAKKSFNVANGNLPSKRVGTFTAAERKQALTTAGSTSDTDAAAQTVKDAQTMLKALGYYTGEITGHMGDKTKAAVKRFQKEYDLTADGVLGTNTVRKLTSVYQDKKGGTVSGSTTGLKRGSTGTQVRNLQQDLTTLGYYWAEITGSFGAKTETAVKTFQKKNGLPADGVAGAKTLSAIADAVTRKGGSSSGSYPANTVLKLNSTGSAVTKLQTDLKQLGYYYGSITGNFGTKTENAVRDFQRAKKLPVDGNAGTKTLEAISAAVAAAGGSSGEGLKVGSTGSKVTALQQNLTALGYYYGDVTGHYGTMTKNAVEKFQKAKGIKADGIAGATTLAAISKALGGGSSSTTGSLREGDKGTAVLELQTMLKELKYYYGDLTGSYGSMTKKAVKKFQEAQGMTVDGIAGMKTINKLRSLTGRPTSGGSSSGGASYVTMAQADSFFLVTQNGVRLRTTYSLDSAAKATMNKDDPVQAKRRYDVGGTTWYNVVYKDNGKWVEGFVRGKVLRNVSQSTFIDYGGNINGSAERDEIRGMIRVTGNNVSIREDADKNSKKVAAANKGDLFYYVDIDDGWYQLQNGYWIHKDNVVVMSDKDVEDYLGGGDGGTYEKGDEGAMVTWIQEALQELGYYDAEITGHYGDKTYEAVRVFQRENDLSADGVAGPRTIARIMEEYNKKTGGATGDATYNETIYNLDWFNYISTYRSELGSSYAYLTDIATGRRMKVKIQSVGNHADVEPATAEDTAVLCSLYNVSSASQLESLNKYQRRAVVVTGKSGKQYIGSIYAIPHGENTVSGNNFVGQFCVHFKNSKTHGTDRVDWDKDGHQEKIQKAANTLNGYKQSNGVTITVKNAP